MDFALLCSDIIFSLGLKMFRPCQTPVNFSCTSLASELWRSIQEGAYLNPEDLQPLDLSMIPQLLMRRASLVAQWVKSLPAVWENWVRSLAWEDPLEKEMATHSSIVAWRSPWTEEPGGLQSTGSQIVRHDWVTNVWLMGKLCTFIFPHSG